MTIGELMEVIKNNESSKELVIINDSLHISITIHSHVKIKRTFEDIGKLFIVLD